MVTPLTAGSEQPGWSAGESESEEAGRCPAQGECSKGLAWHTHGRKILPGRFREPQVFSWPWSVMEQQMARGSSGI